MKTLADLFPLTDEENDSLATIEEIVDAALDLAVRTIDQAGSNLKPATGKIDVPISHTLRDQRLTLTAWRHVAAAYRLKGWAVSFVTEQGRSYLRLHP